MVTTKTETTGESSNKELPKQMPWERVWNSLRQPEQPKQTQRQQDMTASMMPWERAWLRKGQPTPNESKFNMDKYLDVLGAVESSNDPNAKATTSSASGLYQFTSGTWMELVGKTKKDYTLNDRFDPVKSREMAVELTNKNMEKAEKQLGRKPTATELYLYHFLGSPKRLIEAPKDQPAKNFVSAAAVKANRSVFYNEENKPRTVADVIGRFQAKFGGI